MLRDVGWRGMRETDARRLDVASRTVTRQLERERQGEFAPRRVQRRGGRIVDQEQEAAVVAVGPRRDAIAQQPAIASQAIESFFQGGTGSKRVFDEVQGAAGQRLGEMDAQRLVARKGRGETPRRVGDCLGDAHAGIVEPRSPEEVANRLGVDLTALDPGDQVRQDPALDG
jgi:hypothetical protein